MRRRESNDDLNDGSMDRWASELGLPPSRWLRAARTW
jgi:hypothetical protein